MTIYDTDIRDHEREYYSQRFACEGCGDICVALDAMDGTLCFPCWEREQYGQSNASHPRMCRCPVCVDSIGLAD